MERIVQPESIHHDGEELQLIEENEMDHLGSDLTCVTQSSQDEMEDNRDRFDQPGTAVVKYATSKKKGKKLSSVEMYNNIRGESELIANIVSSDGLETYHKIMTLLRYDRANIHNKTGHKLKEAAATYMHVTDFGSSTKIIPSS